MLSMLFWRARWRHRFWPAAALALLMVLISSAAFAQSSEDCLACHSDTSMSMAKLGRTVSLFVNKSVLNRTGHRDLACVDCHTDFDPDNIPHKANILPVDCTTCHGDARDRHTNHASMLEGGTAAHQSRVCKDCHGTHMDPGVNDTCGLCHNDETRTYLRSAHGVAFGRNSTAAPDCLRCHSTDIVGLDGRTAAQLKTAQLEVCTGCHASARGMAGSTAAESGFVQSFTRSVHGRELAGGNASAANCVDCHGSHDLLKGLTAASSVHKMRIPGTCGKCHSDIARVYNDSIHGVAVADGNLDSPTCTDCHGEHNILRPKDPRSPVAPGNVSAQVCGTCHGSVKLSERYGVRSDRFQTFADSYHGLAIRGGSVRAANCASCHGAHNILPASDPRSMVHKANLPKTCGTCHAGANERFAVGQVHVVVSPKQQPVLYIVAMIYIVLIVLVIGAMALHNAVDLAGKWWRHVQSHDLHGIYERMSVSERVQHLLLTVSFIALVITGFMLHYPEAFWVVWIRSLSSHVFDLRSLLHRVSGVVLIGAALYHIYYSLFTQRGRRLILDLLPRRQDVYDTIAMMKYYLRRRESKPKLGRFSYIEKSEYWALVWGTAVMSITGIILWLEEPSINLITKLGWDISRIIHFYEAWLATLAIAVWHFYFVIFNPDVYPMNASWINGTLPEDVLEEEHPLEYEQLKERLNAEGRKLPSQQDDSAE